MNKKIYMSIYFWDELNVWKKKWSYWSIWSKRTLSPARNRELTCLCNILLSE